MDLHLNGAVLLVMNDDECKRIALSITFMRCARAFDVDVLYRADMAQ